MPHPDRFYPVVDSLAWIERLARLGVGTVQLRAKDLSHGDAVKLVRGALAITRGTSTELVVNDYWRAAIEAGRLGYEAGLMEARDFASPSTPVVGTPFWHAATS